MRPRFSINNFTDLVLSNTKLNTKSDLGDSSGCVTFSYLPNLFLVQNRISTLLSLCARIIKVRFWSACPAFLLHVVHVVLVSADEQVRRITAGAIIAFMQYVKAFRNRTFFQLVSHAVCACVLSIYFHFSISGFGIYGGFPHPTLTVSFYINTTPKPFFEAGSRTPPFHSTKSSKINPLFMCNHDYMNSITTIGV